MENNVLRIFIDKTLNLALYERIDAAFPEFRESRHKGVKWESKKHLDGSTTKDDYGCYIGTLPAYKYFVADRNPSREKGALDYIAFYMQRNNTDFKTALKALCEVCNLTPPLYGNEEEYRKHQSRQARLLHIVEKMRAALFTEEGKATLTYLKNGRGYSESLCKDMGLGCLTKEIFTELFDTKDKDTGETLCTPSGYLRKGGAEAYPLALPFIVSGAILGFKFRTIQAGKEGAEKWQNTVGLERRPFGLTDTKLTGHRNLDLDIVVVESELDALRAQALGFGNIVAAAGGSLSKEGLQELIKKGAKRITVALDTEATPEQNAKTDQKREAMAKAAIKEGLRVYVATFPSMTGYKMDLDDFLNSGTIDDLRNIIEGAPSFAFWKYGKIEDAIREKAEEKGVTLKMLERDLIDAAAALCVEYANPFERTTISRKIEDATGTGIRAEDFEAYTQKKHDEANKEKITRETQEAATKAQELIEEGKTREALSLMEHTAKKAKELDTEAEFSELLRQPSIDEILQELSRQPDGFHTSYFFDNHGTAEQLIIPSGAITFVCGLAGHGKSTFLMNLAVEMAQDSRTEGQVLYFTYEEKKAAIQQKFENICLHEYLSKNNLRTLHTLHTTGKNTLSYDSPYKNNLEGLKRKQREALRIFEKIHLYEKTEFDVDKLAAAIKYLCRNMKVKAVFIDYVQRLSKKGFRGEKKDELREISNTLIDLTVSTGLPVILAAQFNRDMKSPLDMRPQNLADSADLERAANVIVGLWNTSFNLVGGAKLFPQEEEAFKNKGVIFGQYGKIYAKILKNRDGVAEIDGAFDYDGNKGTITDTKHAEYYKRLLNEDEEKRQTVLTFEDEANTAAPESDVIMKKDDDYLPF